MSSLNSTLQTFEPKERRYEHTVVLVPFFDGTVQQLLPHIRMLNQLGFRVASFDLKMKSWLQLPLVKENGKVLFGIKHLWAKKIAEVLDQVEGKKVLFTLSNPSSCALEAMALRPIQDVELIICDGGPFDLMVECGENLLEHYYKWKNPLIRKTLNIGLYALWSPIHHKTLHKSLAQLPHGFPILSIRAEEDELVPPRAIEAAFAGHSQLKLEILNLSGVKHLKGLKDQPAVYRSKVSDFLQQYLKYSTY
ncbi:MAG: alpha/beta hydrolase family protein [Bdellovibrionales bacterium]